MATGKKSVLLYCDLIHTIEKMDDETAGQFFKHYLRYINDKNPKTDNLVVELTFENVKQNLKRDLLKWESIKEKRSEAGKKSAESRALKKSKQTSTNLTSVKSVKQTSTNPTVNDTVNVTVTDTVNVKDSIDIREADFKKSLQPFLESYGKDVLKEFYLYWTEKKPKGRKMKYEMQKTFDVSRRLARWAKNDFNSNNNLKAENNEQLKNITTSIRDSNPEL